MAPVVSSFHGELGMQARDSCCSGQTARLQERRTAKPAASIDFSSVALAGPLQVPASSVLILA